MTPRNEQYYESQDELRHDLLADEEFRCGYAESFLNTFVAAQIKAIREQRGLTQAQLAEKIGSKQAGISRLENVNYSAWKTETLRKLARALNVRLKITFETFGALLDEVEDFNRESLERPAPAEDAGLTQPKRRLAQTAVVGGEMVTSTGSSFVSLVDLSNQGGADLISSQTKRPNPSSFRRSSEVSSYAELQ